MSKDRIKLICPSCGVKVFGSNKTQLINRECPACKQTVNFQKVSDNSASQTKSFGNSLKSSSKNRIEMTCPSCGVKAVGSEKTLLIQRECPACKQTVNFKKTSDNDTNQTKPLDNSLKPLKYIRSKYISANLTSGEYIVAECVISKEAITIGYIITPIVVSILTIPVFLIANAISDPIFTYLGIFHLLVSVALIVAGMILQNTEFAITNKRLVYKLDCFIVQNTQEIDLMKLESVTIVQGFLGRAYYNYGAIIVSGTGNSSFRVNWIKDPIAFRKKIIEAQDKLKQQLNNLKQPPVN